MDVGLYNRNTLGEVNPAFTDVVFLVEATSSEQQKLWEEYSDQSTSNITPLSENVLNCLREAVKSWPILLRVEELNKAVIENNGKRVKWESVSAGFGITIGNVTGENHKKQQLKKLPVCVSFNFAIINGKKICFYYPTSVGVDHDMIEDFLIERFQLTHDDYTRWNHTDAGNFHNCVNSLDRLDKEPRDTVYKKK